MIVVSFALPEESQDLRKALRDTSVVDGCTRGFLAGAAPSEEICIVHTGVGPVSAAAAMAKVLAGDHPRVVLSSGYAGGLDPRLGVADLVVATNLSSPGLVELCQIPAAGRRIPSFGPLTSQVGVVESVQDKAALAAKTGAIAVDMETESIATACRLAGAPLLSLRVISDSASQPLPVPFEHWFDLDRQRPRPADLVWYLARNPSRILPFARFVRGLAPARRVLTDFLLSLLSSDALRDFSDKAAVSAPC